MLTLHMIFSLTLYFLFLLNNNPLMMSLLLLMLTLPLLFSSMYYVSAWLGMSILLIFSGGMMIIFLYMTSLCSNYKFSLKFPLVTLLPLFMSFNLMEFNSITSYSFFHLWYLYHLNNKFMFLFILIYLILTLLFIVMVSEHYNGSLKKYY